MRQKWKTVRHQCSWSHQRPNFLQMFATVQFCKLQHCNTAIEIARTRVSQTWKKMMKWHLKAESYRFDNFTHLSFRFGVEDFNPMHRKRRFTVIDFLSYFGGVFGLFAGISVLSFFEIFYFFTLRLVANLFVSRKTPKHAIIIVKPSK